MSLKITLITVGNKMPTWVTDACQEYIKRMSKYCQFNLIELPIQKYDIHHHIPSKSRIITLEVFGKTYSSEQLADKIDKITLTESHLCFIIGGPEGIPENIKNKCHESWSISALTLPHTLARICVIEALYRAFTIIHHHPYHNA